MKPTTNRGTGKNKNRKRRETVRKKNKEEEEEKKSRMDRIAWKLSCELAGLDILDGDTRNTM